MDVDDCWFLHNALSKNVMWINLIRFAANILLVVLMSDALKVKQILKVNVEESKTVAQLLFELELSTGHVVLVDGKRVPLDFQINENESVVILPLIAGG